MNKIPVFATALLALAMRAAQAAETQPAGISEAFVRKLVSAINARDLDAVKPLLEPASLACRTQATRDFDRWLLWKDGGRRYTITEPYKIKIETAFAVQGGVKEALKNKASLYWPAAPEASLRLSYHSAPMSIVERVFEVIGKGDAAKLELPCPTEPGLQAFREQQATLAAQERKLTRLWNSLDPTDRQALILMAQQGMKLDGMRTLEQKYRLNTIESLAIMDKAQYADTP